MILRTSKRVVVGSAVLWFAVVTGALMGVLMTRPRAQACECSPSEWRLRLISAASTSSELLAWPPFARLESRPGTVVISSEDFTTRTIDRLHAGDP
jgi:hypothetical protein